MTSPSFGEKWLQDLRLFGDQLDDIIPAGDLGFVSFGRKFLTFCMPELADRMKLPSKAAGESRKRAGSDITLTDSQEELNFASSDQQLDPGQKILDKIYKLRDKLVANENLTLNLKKRFGKRKRTVSFADDKGLPLEDVKIVDSDSDEPHDHKEEKLKISPWIMAFYQPLFDKKRLKRTFVEKGIALETLDVEDTRMIGTIKVPKSSSPRRVFVRYTMDSWKTHADIKADPVPVDTDLSRVKNNEAVYVFELDLPDDVLHIQFAVCMSDMKGQHHWDDSDGNNYILLHQSCLDGQGSESDSDGDITKL